MHRFLVLLAIVSLVSAGISHCFIACCCFCIALHSCACCRVSAISRCIDVLFVCVTSHFGYSLSSRSHNYVDLCVVFANNNHHNTNLHLSQICRSPFIASPSTTAPPPTLAPYVAFVVCCFFLCCLIDGGVFVCSFV